MQGLKGQAHSAISCEATSESDNHAANSAFIQLKDVASPLLLPSLNVSLTSFEGTMHSTEAWQTPG